MKLFVHSLQEEAQDWFRDFPIAHIATFTDHVHIFRYKWGDKESQSFVGLSRLMKMDSRQLVNLTRSFLNIMQGYIHYSDQK